MISGSKCQWPNVEGKGPCLLRGGHDKKRRRNPQSIPSGKLFHLYRHFPLDAFKCTFNVLKLVRSYKNEIKKQFRGSQNGLDHTAYETIECDPDQDHLNHALIVPVFRV